MQSFEQYFSAWISKYYQNATIGKNGDFCTATNTSKFFGGAIANFILKNLENENLKLPLNIIDLGANNLQLINDVYDFLDAISINVVQNCNFIAIESFANPKQSKIQALKNIKQLQIDCNSFFIANEFFDALPCHLYDNKKIAYINNHKLEFKQNPKILIDLAQNEGFNKGEIPLSYFDFCKVLDSINTHKKRWIFAVFDYGSKHYTNDFNIRIFSNHTTMPLISNNNLINDAKKYYQQSDITYNAPFAY